MNISRRILKLKNPLLSFNKNIKFGYKKRMGYNHIEMQKRLKIDRDLDELTETIDWMDEASEIQSYFYHEFLFNTLAPGMKIEKDIERRLIAEETKSNLKNLKQNLDKTREFVKGYIKQMKKEILEEAQKNPEILKYDPQLYEKLRNDSEAMEEFAKNNEIKIVDNKYFNIPELNQIFVSMNENYDLSFSESYFMKALDEDRLRYNIHMNLVDEFEQIYEEDIDDIIDGSEVHIGERQKKFIQDYIKIVRTDDFKEYSTSYAKTTDNYRVDVGLVISRRPIFLGVHAKDMEFGKYRRKIMQKYHINHSKYIEDFETLNDVPAPFWDACSGQFKISSDNKPNIRKWNTLEKKYDFYCSNSKHFSLVDPNVTNPKSIQYESLNNIYFLCRNKFTKEFEFPTTPIYHGDNFNLARYKLYVELTKERFKVYFEDEHPIFQLTRKFHDYELADPKNKGLNGVRAFYFPAFHFRGTPQVYINNRHAYDDFIFTTKMKFNKVATEKYYHALVHGLSEFEN